MAEQDQTGLTTGGGGSRRRRDDAADVGDDLATERDEAATDRDARAEEADVLRLQRESDLARRAAQAANDLEAAGQRDATRWVDAISAVTDALSDAESSGTVQAWDEVRRAEERMEVQTETLFQAGLDRDRLGRELRAIADELWQVSQDRRAAASQRQAARDDREAARHDRDTARSARHQAAIDRAEPPSDPAPPSS